MMSYLNRESGGRGVATLDANRRVIAETAMELHYERQPALRAKYDSPRRAKALRDAEYTLVYLSSALRARSLPLFADYVSRLRTVLAGY